MPEQNNEQEEDDTNKKKQNLLFPCSSSLSFVASRVVKKNYGTFQEGRGGAHHWTLKSICRRLRGEQKHHTILLISPHQQETMSKGECKSLTNRKQRRTPTSISLLLVIK
jgi:hypothetical protein